MVDPRLEVIGRRLSKVDKILAIASGKGGVGKSVISSALALSLRGMGRRVGLLDLDLTSPSTHLILGVDGLRPIEDMGIIPPRVHGLSYMSIVLFSPEEPIPLRGVDISNAMVELLAITRWEDLDYLIVDMPPGIGDEVLDTIRLMGRSFFLLVSTPSPLALETVRKLLYLLLELKAPIVGVIENMAKRPTNEVKRRLEELGVAHLGAIGYDPRLEEALGHVDRLMRTRFMEDIGKLAGKVESRLHKGS
ncbi:P-loop NTPase [Candidatus Bathyarchaeota archaeon]|nr:P-loop NTPase [Candidatus Bathyarchaeota archaeon]